MREIKPTDKILCRFLRAKSPYGTNEGGDNPWYLADNANTICWCIKSPGGAGPDNGFVDPLKCVAGRTCFEAPTRQG